MPLKFFLNIDHNSGGQIDEKGRCVVRTKDNVSGELSLIKASILKTNNNVDKDYVSAIPYSKAREYLFQEYLVIYGQNEEVQNAGDIVEGQINELCVGEWLGFAAMLALRQMYGLEITQKRVDSSKFSGIGKTLYNSKNDMLCHGRILPLLGENADGNDYIIYVQSNSRDIPVGMLNPRIIFTPGFWSDEINGKYPWAAKGRFINPLPDLTRGQKMILYKWLENAKIICANYQYVTTMLNNMLGMIMIEPNDIRRLRGASVEREDSNIVDVIPMNILLSYVDISSLSACEYIVNNNIGVIVFNVNEEKALVKYGQNRLVRGFLDSELLSKMYDKHKKNKRELDKFLDMFEYDGCREIIIIEDDLSQYLKKYISTEKVYYFSTEKLKDGYKLNPNMICNGRYYVLALGDKYTGGKKEDAEIIEKLLSMIKVKEDDDDGVHMLYQFASNKNPEKFIFEAVVSLDQQEGEHIYRNVPTSYVWPNIADSSKYYMVSSRVNSNDGYLVFAPNGHSVSVLREDHYFEMSEWPKYMEVYQMSNDTYKLMGLVSASSPNAKKASGTTAVYSVDFGTSSTNVGVRITEPAINSFSNQTMIITETERFANVKSINEVFYGDFPVSAPFPTLYYERYIGNDNFSDGHTYFVETNKTINIKDRNIKSNIKFGSSNEDKIRYINSLLNYIMVDAKKAGYSKIEFIFSYSFSMPNPDIFKAGIKAIIERLRKENRYGVKIAGEAKFISESVAALKYARKTEETNEIVVIDIGGGSVDICVHSPSENEEDLSLRIASFEHGSRHFFINNFKLNYKFLPRLLSNNKVIAAGKNVESFYTNADEFRKKVINGNWQSTAVSDDNEDNKILPNPDSFIENLFSLNIEDKGIPRNLGAELKDTFLLDDDISKKFYQTLWMFQLSAIMFYSAMMAAEMQKKRENNFFNTITIMLAGKGSKIIGWLPEKSMDKLKGMFENTFNSYKFDRKVVCEIRFDENSAKNEGVLGMLNDTQRLADRDDLGEKDVMEGYLRGEQGPDKKEFSEIDIINGDKLDYDDELPVYQKFIKTFNDLAGRDFYKIEMKEDTETNLKEMSGEIVLDKRKVNDSVHDHIQQRIEHSVFLSVTKKIVRELSELGGKKFD